MSKTHLVVMSVSKGSQAEAAGVTAGNVIVSVNGALVPTDISLIEELRAARHAGLGTVQLCLCRSDTETSVELALDRELGIVTMEHEVVDSFAETASPYSMQLCPAGAPVLFEARSPVGMNRGAIFGKGLAFCAPSACFWLFAGLGQGGDVGGVIVFALGLIGFLLGLPWNVVLTIAWYAVAQALDHPAWLGNTRNEWFIPVAILATSVPGAFINGVIRGGIIEKRKSEPAI